MRTGPWRLAGNVKVVSRADDVRRGLRRISHSRLRCRQLAPFQLPRGARGSPPCRPRRGLYDPRYESDSCGVAFLADLQGRASHTIVAQALTALHNLDHRGAAGAEPSSGDGAGITVQIPDAFLRAVVGFELPAAGAYAAGIAFLPVDPGRQRTRSPSSNRSPPRRA